MFLRWLYQTDIVAITTQVDVKSYNSCTACTVQFCKFRCWSCLQCSQIHWACTWSFGAEHWHLASPGSFHSRRVLECFIVFWFGFRTYRTLHNTKRRIQSTINRFDFWLLLCSPYDMGWSMVVFSKIRNMRRLNLLLGRDGQWPPTHPRYLGKILHRKPMLATNLSQCLSIHSNIFCQNLRTCRHNERTRYFCWIWKDTRTTHLCSNSISI